MCGSNTPHERAVTILPNSALALPADNASVGDVWIGWQITCPTRDHSAPQEVATIVCCPTPMKQFSLKMAG